MLDFLLRKLIVTLAYLANYGYTDGSGDWYITIDTEKCDSCGKCIEACPLHMFEVAEDDYGDKVAVVKVEHRKKIKYDCAPCHPKTGEIKLPCVVACEPGAIIHTWKPR